MSTRNPFLHTKEITMTHEQIANALGVSRKTIHRWAIGALEGLPRLILLAIAEGKVSLDTDIPRYRRTIMTLNAVLGGGTVGSVAPDPAPSIAAVGDRETYVDRDGIERYGDTHDVVARANPLSGWRAR